MLFKLKIVALLSVLLFLSCGPEVTGASGENGKIRYSIYTDYELNSNLTRIPLATNISHEINVRNIADDNMNYEKIYHEIEPANGKIIWDDMSCYDEDNGYCAGDFKVKVYQPGVYKLKTMYKGEVYDFIELKFKDIGNMDIIKKVREPYSENFENVYEENITVVEGSQIAFIAVPEDADGNRLIGDLECDYEVDDKSMAVPGQDVDEVYEEGNGIFSSKGDANFYMIEEGTVRFIITEKESNFKKVEVINVVVSEEVD